MIISIWKETHQTEKLEEAGYRSPTWAVLRALQQINSATRIEGVWPSFLSVGGTRRYTLLGGKRRTNGGNMGEPIRTRKEKLARRVEHDARLGRVVQVKKKGGGNPLIWAQQERIFSNYDETKSKEEKNKKNGSKTHRGQSVWYSLWWKRGNIKMAVSEDHASCWVQKDLTVTTTKNQALSTAARASGGKDECQVQLTGIEREYWMGTDCHRVRQVRRLRFLKYSHSGRWI